MSESTTQPGRRRFIKLTALGVAAAPLGAAVLSNKAHAQEKVDPATNPIAQQLGYVENASEVDASKFPTFQEGQNCANCQLYVDAQAQDGYAPCGIFAGNLVAAEGWCSAWVVKA
ncbi:MAG: high-potential iron-sulfur protein [Candidatus Competibacterales bacterium]